MVRQDISIRTRDLNLIAPLHRNFIQVWNDDAKEVVKCQSQAHLEAPQD